MIAVRSCAIGEFRKIFQIITADWMFHRQLRERLFIDEPPQDVLQFANDG
jgi:hypothetical protein